MQFSKKKQADLVVNVKHAAPAAKPKAAAPDTREGLIKALLRRKFIKDAMADGRLTETNLRKTPLARLTRMLERGSYNG